MKKPVMLSVHGTLGLTFVWHTVNGAFVSALEGREGLLGGPGRLVGGRQRLDEAAFEGVLGVVVGYWVGVVVVVGR